ncbi:hypothetical protein BDV96DRAFT_601031 [Lophiotrema nucula]|uniref:HRDC domain-containing protein n=1 Tax=Lophiotrema nucula TaxID=690887 RepID=A0A6A5Z3Q9_9PLEO|nr:hypothetical protein BDV96DRAFT_601031 [Lophiotrema nucula]
MESDGHGSGEIGAADGTAPAEKSSDDTVASWPLSFRLQDPQAISGGWFGQQPPKRCKTKTQSELIAKRFLNEPVVGFDMEWPVWGHKTDRLQCKIGLIQLACEDKIALFHIGLHMGKTAEDIIAPSLRKILESASILKTGVGVLGADFSRLKRYFGLKPQAAFELSHLHRLVTYGAHKPELVTTKLVSLADQVESHLGLPLNKGKARTSNWSKALDQQQITYAAADAYAGYMLFMCMNSKRAAMNPTPPLPVHAETYGSHAWGKASIRSLQLGPDKNGKIASAEDFFAVQAEIEPEGDDEEGKDEGNVEGGDSTEAKKKTPKTKVKEDLQPLDEVSKKLFGQLSNQRKTLAAAAGVESYVIAGNAVLQRLAVQRPADEVALLGVKGIGKKKTEVYGPGWLEIISSFVARIDTVPFETSNVEFPKQDIPASSSSSEELLELVIPSRRSATPANAREVDSSSASSPAFGSPMKRTPRRRQQTTTIAYPVDPPSSQDFDANLQRTPQLHTGLSFSLAETKLESQETIFIEDDSLGDDSSEEYLTPPSQSSSALKRKRSPNSPGQRRRSPTPTSQEDLFNSRTMPGRTSTHDKGERPIFSMSQQLFRNKLEAFRKRVEAKLDPKPLQPIVESHTLDLIVLLPSVTDEELSRIPEIEGFSKACSGVGMDLFKNVVKFGLGPG